MTVRASGSPPKRTRSPRAGRRTAGVRAGDVILRFEGRVVSTPDELIVAVRARDVGDQVTLEIRRDGTTRTVTMTLVAAGG